MHINKPVEIGFSITFPLTNMQFMRIAVLAYYGIDPPNHYCNIL